MGGTEGGIDQISRLSPEQQQAFSGLIKDFDPAALTQMFQTSIANPARQQFRQQSIPGIQERFQSTGGAGSSGLGLEATGAAATLESGLSGQLAQLLAGAQESHLNRQSGLSTANTMDSFQVMSENPLMDLLGPALTAGATAAGGPLGGAAASGLTGMMAGKNQPK